jgi:hypothetical protein
MGVSNANFKILTLYTLMQYGTQVMEKKRLSVNTVCELFEKICFSQYPAHCAVPVDELLRPEEWSSCQKIQGTSSAETG